MHAQSLTSVISLSFLESENKKASFHPREEPTKYSQLDGLLINKAGQNNVIDTKVYRYKYPDGTEKKIIKRICVMFQISEDGLRSQSRDRKHIKARQATVFLLKELTSLSLNEIGKIIGRNHSTVHSTMKKVRLRMSEDDFFLKQMKTFQKQIENKPVSSQIPEQKLNFSL